MKRLTERDKNGTAMAVCCGENCKHNFCCENGDFAECGDMDDIIDRFAAIEDILGDEYELDRLWELVEVRDTLKEFAEDVARQFGYRGTTPDGRAAYTAGGLSTLEWAWSLLGWPDPKPAPECERQEESCHEWANGGRPTPDGYKWLCSRHYLAYEAREEALNAREQND